MSPRKMVYLVLVGLVAAALIGSIVLNVLTMMGYFPDTDVIYKGENMNQRHRKILEKNGIVHPDEEIIMFFSAGIFSVLEDGNLFTPSRVILYQKSDEEGLETFSIPFREIKSISMNTSNPSHQGFSMILVESDSESGRGFGIPVSQVENADAMFYEGLTNAWIRVRPEAAAPVDDPGNLELLSALPEEEDSEKQASAPVLPSETE